MSMLKQLRIWLKSKCTRKKSKSTLDKKHFYARIKFSPLSNSSAIAVQIILDKHAQIDDSLAEQCIAIQNDVVSVNLYKRFVNLRHSWFGLSTSSWLKTFQFPVDYLFDEERNGTLCPLFDIVRLINFSRSAMTKQCIRCGNYTESGSQPSGVSGSAAKVPASILMQDLCGDKCICGGSWVQSPIQ